MRRALPLVLLLAACGDPGGGAPTVTLSGGDYALHGIPASAVSDGWDIHLDLVLVSIGGVQLIPPDDGTPLSAPGFQVFDLHKPGDLVLATFPDDTGGGDYGELRYVIRPDPTAVSANAGSDAIALRNGGKSLRIKGTAAKGDELRWFDWTFAKDVTHARCDFTGDAGALQATIHVEQLFVDDLVASDPHLAFDLISSADGADGTNPDGIITEGELAVTPLAGQSRYQVGGLPIDNLAAFIAHQAGTVGRFNGDERCLAVVDAAP